MQWIDETVSCAAAECFLCLAVLLMVSGLCVPEGTASSSVRTLGVVDFYAVSPSGSFEGSFPEWFAADDLSDLLTRAGGDHVAVIPRGVVRQAEASGGWRSEDVLRFERLASLAHAIGADQLVVCWITMMNVETGGSHDGGAPMADVSVVVQVFDIAQRRIVAETRQSISAVLFGTRTSLAEQGLHLTLSPTVPWLVHHSGENIW